MKIFSMRGTSYIYKLGVVALIALTADSCKKPENGFGQNNQVVIKPYSMFLVDSLSGNMEKTNDGNTYSFVKGNGGNAGRAIATSGNYIIWVMKPDLGFASVSEGNDNQFNPIKSFGPNPVSFNQSMILDVPEYKNGNLSYVYMAGNSGFGVIYSDSNGKRNSWRLDAGTSSDMTGVQINSLAKTEQALFGYDYVSNTLITKPGLAGLWGKVTTIGLPTDGKFFLSSFNNTLVLADSTGKNGVWYSNNSGASWLQYQGLPTGAKVTCARSAFGQVLLVGTAQYGMFRVANGNLLEQMNNGLASDLVVRNITSKSDIYKNDQVKQYIYIATNKGIFRSVDLGANWIQVKTGNYVLIY